MTKSKQNLLIDILTKVGIRPNVVGFKYIVDAVDVIYDKDDEISFKTMSMMEVYEAVAARNVGSTPVRVERGIRTAIKHASSEEVGMVNLSSKMTNSEFIYSVVVYLGRIEHV